MLKNTIVLLSTVLLSLPAIGSEQKQDHRSAHSSHSNQKLEVKAGEAIPTVSLKVIPDAKRGWNIQMITTNFKFAPESVNLPNIAGEGHGHLLINGERINRLYSPWYHIKSLPPGKNTITVTLNSNTHQALSNNGQPISATQSIVVPTK